MSAARPSQLRRPSRRGFTLLELVLVLAIIAILAGVLVPSLTAFAAGRRTNNAATLVLGLANFARTQAVSEGTVYRINLDANAGRIWLTKQVDGTFEPVPGDWGTPQPLPDGVQMRADVTPGSVVVPVQRTDVTPNLGQPVQLFGRPVGTPNAVQQLPRTDGGTYVEIQPSGRTDPCHVRLTDTAGHTVDIGAVAATDVIHVLRPEEL